MALHLGSGDISPELAAMAQQMVKKKAVNADELLTFAKANDGRVTQAEVAFIEALQVEGNRKIIADSQFSPETLTYKGEAIALIPFTKGGAKSKEAVQKLNDSAHLSPGQIAIWRDTRNTSALADVLQDPDVPQTLKQEVVRALLALGPTGILALEKVLPPTETNLKQIQEHATSSQEAVQVGALAFLKRAGKATAGVSPELAAKADLRVAEVQVLEQKAKREALRGEGVALHHDADKVTHQKSNGEDRIGLIPGVIDRFAKLGAKIDAALLQIDQTLAATKTQMDQAKGPHKTQLEALYQQLLAEKSQLTRLKTDWALDQAHAAVECSKSSNFPSFGAGMSFALRSGFLEKAKQDLAGVLPLTSDPTLRKGIQAATGDVTQAIASYQQGKVEADQLAAHRLTLLQGLNQEFNALGDLIFQEGLIQKAAKGDQAALERLNQLRNQMVAVIEKVAMKKGEGAYTADGSLRGKGAEDICKGLMLIVGELKAFKFDKDSIQGLSSFEEQVKDLRKGVFDHFKGLFAKGFNPKEEIKLAFAVQEKVDSAINKPSLVQAKRDAASNGLLDSWSAKAAAQYPVWNRDADVMLENPDFGPNPVDSDLKAYQASLEKLRQQYVLSLNPDPKNWLMSEEKKAELAKNSPVVKVIDLLSKRSALFQPGGKVDGVALAKIDEEIGQLMSSEAFKGDPHFKRDPVAYGSLRKMVASAQAMDGVFGYHHLRVVGTPIPDSADALKIGKDHITYLAGKPENKDYCFGLVDLGWKDGKKLGYQVVRYPIGELDAKIQQAKGQGGLVLIAGTRMEKALGVGAPVPTVRIDGKTQPSGDLFTKLEPGLATDETTDKKAKRTQVVEAIGKRARDLVWSQYEEAIKAYQGYTKDPKALVAFVARALAGKSKDEQRQFLTDFFGYESPLTASNSAWKALDEILPLVEAYNKNPDRDWGSHPVVAKSLMPAAKERLALLDKAQKSAFAMSYAEAAFKLPAKFPGIRQEIYREFGFRFDPTKSPPLDGDQIDAKVKGKSFTTSAEMIYAQEAKRFAKIETVEEIAKTTGMITAALAIGLATGGSGVPMLAVAGAIGTGAVMSGIGIYAAKQELDQTKAAVSAGFVGHESLTAADNALVLAYVSAVVQVGMSGASIAVGTSLEAGGTVAGEVGKKSVVSTIKRAVLGADGKTLMAELAIGTVQTLVDPTSYTGGVKGFLVNLGISGVTTYVGVRAGAALAAKKAGVDVPDDVVTPLPKDLVEGKAANVIFDQAQKKAFMHTADGQTHEVVPIKQDGDVVSLVVVDKKGRAYLDPKTKQPVVIDINVKSSFSEAVPLKGPMPAALPDGGGAPAAKAPKLPPSPEHKTPTVMIGDAVEVNGVTRKVVAFQGSDVVLAGKEPLNWSSLVGKQVYLDGNGFVVVKDPAQAGGVALKPVEVLVHDARLNGKKVGDIVHLDGKSYEVKVAGPVAEVHAVQPIPLAQATEHVNKVQLGMTASKEYRKGPTGQFETDMTVPAAKVKPVPEGKPPSAKDFQAWLHPTGGKPGKLEGWVRLPESFIQTDVGPLHFNDLVAGKVIPFGNEPWTVQSVDFAGGKLVLKGGQPPVERTYALQPRLAEVTGYNPATGMATVKRYDQLTLEIHDNKAVASQFGAPLDVTALKPGQTLSGLDGRQWQVFEINRGGQPRLLLRSVQVTDIPIHHLKAMNPTGAAMEVGKGVAPKVLAKGSAVSRAYEYLTVHRNAPPADLAKVGPKAVASPTKVSEGPAFFPFSAGTGGTSGATTTAVTYQVTVPGPKGDHTIQIVVPVHDIEVSPGVKMGHKAMLAKAKEAIANMPVEMVESLSVMRFNPGESTANAQAVKTGHYKEGSKAPATAVNGTIDVFPTGLASFHLDPTRALLPQLMWHEMGHTYAMKYMGGAEGHALWVKAVQADGPNNLPSSYGGNNYAEDLAETIRLYVASKGGQSDFVDPYTYKKVSGAETRKKFGERFKVLDEHFKLHPGDKAALQADFKRTMVKMLMAAGLTATAAYQLLED